MLRLHPKAKWKQFRGPEVPGIVHDATWYGWGDLRVCVARENGMWHISVSHPYRYPTWDEIYTAWYDLVPDAEQITGAILLPRKAEYVNVHPNCFHVHQLRDTEVVL